jgi:hypothetical protein
MPQFFVTIQLPDSFDPSQQSETLGEEVHAIGLQMAAAGVKEIFAGGLYPPTMAKSLRPQPDGTVLVTDGPYAEAKEYVGGISILECADMDEVLKWASKTAAVCRMPGEVREIFFVPPPDTSV